MPQKPKAKRVSKREAQTKMVDEALKTAGVKPTLKNKKKMRQMLSEKLIKGKQADMGDSQEGLFRALRKGGRALKKRK